MWSFEGDFKSKPKQSLRGASRTLDRNALLSRAKFEREERQEQKRREASAIKLQSWVRGELCRIKTRRRLRGILDDALNRAQKKGITEEEAEKIIALLIRIFNDKVDYQRLMNICQLMVKEKKSMTQWMCNSLKKWTYLIPRLIEMSLAVISSADSNNISVNFASPLRLLEITTTPETWDHKLSSKHQTHFLVSTLGYLVKHSYYKSLCLLLLTKVPLLYEPTLDPPVPLAESLFILLLKPLQYLHNHSEYISSLYKEIIQYIFGASTHLQIRNYILPSISAKIIKYSNNTNTEIIDLTESQPDSMNTSNNREIIDLTETKSAHNQDIHKSLAKDILDDRPQNKDQYYNQQSQNSINTRSNLVNASKKMSTFDDNLINPICLENLFIFLAKEENIELLDQCDAPALLYSLLAIVKPCGIKFEGHTALSSYLRVIGHLMGRSTQFFGRDFLSEDDSDDDEDLDMDYSEPTDVHWLTLKSMASDTIEDINSTNRVAWLLSQVEENETRQVLLYLSQLIHHLLTVPGFQLHQCRLLYSLISRKSVLRSMWTCLSSLRQGVSTPSFSNPLPGYYSGVELLQIVSRGSPLSPKERDTLVPLLATFCATLKAAVSTLHDSEFLGEPDEALKLETQSKRLFPFTIDEIVKMSAMLRDVCVGLAELAHPDQRMSAFIVDSYSRIWCHCFKVCVSVTRQIHLRDTRRDFCPENFWVSPRVSLPTNGPTPTVILPVTRRQKLFTSQKWRTKDELEMEGPPLSLIDQRRATILHELPFVFNFKSRMLLFTNLVACDRGQHQFHANFNVGSFINVAIRRDFIYEDAFDKLSPSNEPNLRLRMRVSLMNVAGMNEAGIDGGGIFREFLSELLKTAFDPTRGFFLLTRENTLYPNPSAHLVTDDYQNHYYFIGRMLGKALYENLLVEVPLAGFFLSKLLRSSSSSVEFHHLDSLDPELCRNLLYLKTYEGDVQDLGLDFTIFNSDLGQNSVEELIPNGGNFPVTKENRIEYIYRMADYKLNKQIAKQCDAFRKGVFDVVSSHWLQMFDWRELQMMISGTSMPIVLTDLMEHCKYSGGYTREHITIATFWDVVLEFDDDQLRKLLKFVTSCSRPPLLGFKELQPPFCIQPSGSEDRLPTASTCMNLLKLPEYKDPKTLKKKLLYAITSGAGFELS